MTDSSRRTAFHGVTIGRNRKIFDYGASTWDRFKRWGINSVYLVTYHVLIETNEYQAGVYSQSVLQIIDRQAEYARQRGIYLPIGLSGPYDDPNPSYTGWKDWGEKYGWEYINFNKDPMNSGVGGRDRWINCLVMLAKRYPDCGIGLTFFPYHRRDEPD